MLTGILILIIGAFAYALHRERVEERAALRAQCERTRLAAALAAYRENQA